MTETACEFSPFTKLSVLFFSTSDPSVSSSYLCQRKGKRIWLGMILIRASFRLKLVIVWLLKGMFARERYLSQQHRYHVPCARNVWEEGRSFVQRLYPPPPFIKNDVFQLPMCPKNTCHCFQKLKKACSLTVLWVLRFGCLGYLFLQVCLKNTFPPISLWSISAHCGWLSDWRVQYVSLTITRHLKVSTLPVFSICSFCPACSSLFSRSDFNRPCGHSSHFMQKWHRANRFQHRAKWQVKKGFYSILGTTRQCALSPFFNRLKKSTADVDKDPKKSLWSGWHTGDWHAITLSLAEYKNGSTTTCRSFHMRKCFTRKHSHFFVCYTFSYSGDDKTSTCVHA